MKNSRGSHSLSYQMAVLSMIVMFFLQIGILTSFAGDLVRRAQESMVKKGIDPGPIDGIWGPLTRGGVIEFQKSEGLTVSGRLDDATKKRLFSIPETPQPEIKTATEPSAPEKSSPGVPMAAHEKHKTRDLPEAMAKTPAPVDPPVDAVTPDPREGAGSGQNKSSGHCPQPRKTKSAPATIAKMDKTRRANLENGKKLYTKTAKPLACTMCHGDKGDGKGKLGAALKPNPRNFTCNETMKDIPVGQMFWIIKNGSAGTGMVGHKKTLKDNEIWDVIKYIRNTF